MSCDVGERHLRFDHPELGEMAAGVRVLRPERGAERVHAVDGEGVGLGAQLAAHRQERRLAEEVLGVVHRAVFGAGWRGRIERGDPEHLADTLGVARGDQRGVEVEEVAVLVEPVGRVRQGVADPGHGSDRVGARPQVGDLAQVLERDALLLEGIGLRVGETERLDLGRLDLDPLALAG